MKKALRVSSDRLAATLAMSFICSAVLLSCSSGESTSSRVIEIPFAEQFVKGKVTKLATPLPSDNSKDSILIVPTQPNPFSPSTTIDFKVVSEDTMVIYFYHPDGRLISEAFRGYLSAGVYRFEPTDLHINSGVYFVKFQIGSNSSVRKVMLIR